MEQPAASPSDVLGERVSVLPGAGTERAGAAGGPDETVRGAQSAARPSAQTLTWGPTPPAAGQEVFYSRTRAGPFVAVSVGAEFGQGPFWQNQGQSGLLFTGCRLPETTEILKRRAVAMEQPAPRRRSDGSVRECLFFPVLGRNEQERLEALMRRSVERSLQLDHRPKRWTWGGPTPAPAAGQEDFCETPLSALSTVPDLPHDESLPAADQLKNAADSVSAAAVTPPTPDPPIRKRLSSASAALDCKERGK
ncbi:hypothetical protein AGOR_G00141860 [Albula goreensis]|uniref:Uncharacterized protein n=1 Tax=Albula goreensis TaxID=1534307 RepID=A0A8T3D5C2_9TELE|nr:hypothetical protein AGOR_G00141860 [Albula goreensis]